MLSHNVVCDLLPQYIDGLCSDETNKEVSEHLAVCTECESAYKAMTEDIEPVPDKIETKNINYLKKIKSKNLKKIIFAACGVAALAFAFVFIFVIGTPARSDEIVYRFVRTGNGENFDRVTSYLPGIDSNVFELDFYMINEGNLALHQKIDDKKTADGIDRTITLTVNTVPELLGMGRFYYYPLKNVDNPNDRNVTNCKVIVKFADKTLVYNRETNHIVGMSDYQGNIFDCDYYSYNYELQE